MKVAKTHKLLIIHHQMVHQAPQAIHLVPQVTLQAVHHTKVHQIAALLQVNLHQAQALINVNTKLAMNLYVVKQLPTETFVKNIAII